MLSPKCQVQTILISYEKFSMYSTTVYLSFETHESLEDPGPQYPPLVVVRGGEIVVHDTISAILAHWRYLFPINFLIL